MAEEITKEEFDAYGIHRVPMPWVTEKRWFKNGRLLGVIFFDHDGEWAFVVLAEHPAREAGRRYAAIDVSTSFRTQDEALRKLAESFAKHWDIVVEIDDGPVTEEEAIRILSDVSGVSEERVRLAAEDYKKNPRPGNN